MQLFLATSCLAVSLLFLVHPAFATFHKESHHPIVSKIPYPVEHYKYIKVRFLTMTVQKLNSLFFYKIFHRFPK